MVDQPDPIDGPVPVIDRRRWAHGEEAVSDARPGKPSYIEELERLLAEKDKAIQAHAARYRESAGEFEQVRARLRRDMDKEIERARRTVLADVLEVVDNLDRALNAARETASGPATQDSNYAALVKGVELVRELLLAKLASYGVKPIAAAGETFDPRVHEAVSILPVATPDQDERVMGVVREGYTVGDDVLRPAAVVVGRFADDET
jgi:molecular chaperone GrpE